MQIIGTRWSSGATWLYIKCDCGNVVYHNIKKKIATCPLCKGQQTVESMPIKTLGEKYPSNKKGCMAKEEEK